MFLVDSMELLKNTQTSLITKNFTKDGAEEATAQKRTQSKADVKSKVDEVKRK